MAKLLGAHMPTAGGLAKALRNGKAIGCNTIQLFTSNPRQWRGKPVEESLKHSFDEAKKETGIDQIVSHDTYLVNLCATNEETKAKSIQTLTDEMIRCSQLGIPYVVSHMGAHLGQGEETGLQIVAEITKNILKETPDNVILCMETTAGQGSALNYKFEHLAFLLETCQAHPRLAVCLDTCHIFAAGYDLVTQEAYEKTFQQFESIIGLEHLKVIHCNDSKKPLGSKADRHEHIGEGFIGPRAFQLLVNDPRFENIPIILETPEPEKMHEVNLNRLKSYILQGPNV